MINYKSSDSIKPEKPAHRIESSSLALEPFFISQNADNTLLSSILDEFLELMEEWEGQIQDCNTKAVAPKSAKKRASKKS